MKTQISKSLSAAVVLGLVAFGNISIAAPLSTAPAAAPVVHVITIQGRVAGKQTVTKLAGGKIKTEFSYRENGRGPDIFEDITLDANGQLSSFSATGKSTFGAPIAETFVRKDGKATWKSKADAAEVIGVATSMYVPIESSLESGAITGRALAKA
ncbi:MAG: hypothetical protein H7232_15830 [Aeromicrobium sp.]|nr:hypothetical protein [Burkholderiales bacterium]